MTEELYVLHKDGALYLERTESTAKKFSGYRRHYAFKEMKQARRWASEKGCDVVVYRPTPCS